MTQLRNHGPKGKRRKVTVRGSKNDLRSPRKLGNLLLFLSQICSARPFLFWVFGQVTFSLLKKMFYWSIVDLQCCVSFRSTAKQINWHTSTIFKRFFSLKKIKAITEYWVDFPLLYSRFLLVIYFIYTSLVAQTVQNPPAVQETWVRSLGWENPLEEGMATHSGILFFFF